jgi:hypothetical protein
MSEQPTTLRVSNKKEATTVASNTVVTKQFQNDINNFSFIYRIKLDVTVNAPIIILPYADQALLLDCGIIRVQTDLDILNSYYADDEPAKMENVNDRCLLPPVIEIQNISLSNMEISR